MAQMIDWQKDAVNSMWFLSEYERKMRGCKLTDDERREVQECLKKNVARYCRMATQKTAGQRGKNRDLDTWIIKSYSANAMRERKKEAEGHE